MSELRTGTDFSFFPSLAAKKEGRCSVVDSKIFFFLSVAAKKERQCMSCKERERYRIGRHFSLQRKREVSDYRMSILIRWRAPIARARVPDAEREQKRWYGSLRLSRAFFISLLHLLCCLISSRPPTGIYLAPLFVLRIAAGPRVVFEA